MGKVLSFKKHKEIKGFYDKYKTLNKADQDGIKAAPVSNLSDYSRDAAKHKKDRIERIQTSLDKINRLMYELKKASEPSDKTPSYVRQYDLWGDLIDNKKRLKYEILVYDVWGNDIDGYEVNEILPTGDILSLKGNEACYQITQALIDQGYGNATNIKGKLEYQGDFDTGLYAVWIRNGKPAFYLKPVKDQKKEG